MKTFKKSSKLSKEATRRESLGGKRWRFRSRVTGLKVMPSFSKCNLKRQAKYHNDESITTGEDVLPGGRQLFSEKEKGNAGKTKGG